MTTFEGSAFTHGSWAAASISDAEYRAFGVATDAALAGCGLTLVSTTANWASDTVPGAGGGTPSWGNYSIYKFNDGITPDIYLKVTFGRGAAANAAGQYALNVQISPDNSNYTSATVNYIVWGSTAADTSLQWSSCFTESGFVMICDSATIATGQCPPIIVVERSRDYSDAANNTGALLWMNGGAIASTVVNTNFSPIARRMRCSSFVDASATTNSYITYTFPSTASTLTNNTLPVHPTEITIEEYAWNMRTSVWVNSSTVGTLADITVTASSGTRKYRSTRSTNTQWLVQGGHRLCFRWN